MKLIIEKSPNERIASITDKGLKLGEGFVYHESSQSLHKLKVLLKNLEHEPELYVNKKIKLIYNIPSLVDSVNRTGKANRGIISLHSGAMANKKNEGILFSAWQDVGKTTLSLLLAQEGYSIIGDDKVKLSRDGNLFREQKKAGVYPHKSNLKLLPLSNREKIIGWFKYKFLSITFLQKFINQNLWVDYKKIGKVSNLAPLKRVYILERGKAKIQKIDTEIATNKILSTTFSQFLPEGFPRRFIEAYCFANNLSPTYLQDRYKEVLLGAIKDKPKFIIRGNSHLEIYDLLLQNEARF